MLDVQELWSPQKHWETEQKKRRFPKTEKNAPPVDPFARTNVDYGCCDGFLAAVSKQFETGYCRNSTLKMTWIALLKNHVISHLMVRNKITENSHVYLKNITMDMASNKLDDFCFFLGLSPYGGMDKMEEIFDSLVTLKNIPSIPQTKDFIDVLTTQSKFNFTVLRRSMRLGAESAPESLEKLKYEENCAGLGGLTGAFLEHEKNKLKLKSNRRECPEINPENYTERDIVCGVFTMALCVWTVDCFFDLKKCQKSTPESLCDKNAIPTTMQVGVNADGYPVVVLPTTDALCSKRSGGTNNLNCEINHGYAREKRMALIRNGYYPDVADMMLKWCLVPGNQLIYFDLLLEIIRSVEC